MFNNSNRYYVWGRHTATPQMLRRFAYVCAAAGTPTARLAYLAAAGGYNGAGC